MDITTPLTPSELLIAGWRSSHALHGSYYAMNDATTTTTQNPLDVLARMILEHNYLTLPDGSKMKSLTPAFVQAGIKASDLSEDTQRLVATYGLVETAPGSWELIGNQDQHPVPENIDSDPTIVNLETAIASLGPAKVSAPATEPQPAEITQTDDPPATDAPPAAEPPALVLTKDQHEQTRSLLQDIEAGVHWIDDKAKVAYAKLVALLHHV